MNDVTQILQAIDQGDPTAASQLLPLVYDELRRLATQRLAQEKPGQTLQATALVHEAYLRLVGPSASPPSQGGEKASDSPPSKGGAGGVRWNSRGHFFAAAAESMRRILVENARRKHRLKRGGDRQRVDLDEIEAPQSTSAVDLLALDEALDRLAAEDAPKAELIKLRFFAGLSIEEAARCLGISRATADRHWAYARAWLYDRLGTNTAEDSQ